MPGRGELLRDLRGHQDEMLGELERLVAMESPSNDPDALRRCADTVAELGRDRLGAPELVESGDRVHVRWPAESPRVLLLGHFDTVWPLGTIDRWPFEIQGNRATGPGIFDMKAGVVQGIHALASLGGADGVEVLFTSDEEVGGKTSRALIEEAARRVRAVLVLEPSADGALKVARKGGSLYRVSVHGRAAHAGLEPEKGVNAIIEAAHQVLAVERLAEPSAGTTVTPTMLDAGTASNTVPATAVLHVDVRSATEAEQRRVDEAVRALSPVLRGARLTVGGGIDRPPLPRSASAELFERARAAAAVLGLADPGGAEVGGGSDGNFTAALGTPTLDGLGAVGAGAHAEGEWIEIDAMAERAALVAGLVAGLVEA